MLTDKNKKRGRRLGIINHTTGEFYLQLIVMKIKVVISFINFKKNLKKKLCVR